MTSRILLIQLPLLTLGAALILLILAHALWHPHVFGLLSQPLFFILAFFVLALVFYYLTLLYLLIRPRSKPSA